MTATVHKLRPEQAARIAPDAPAGKILLALEQMASGLMTEQLRVMFDGADDLLFEMAEKVRKGPEQQTFLDAMRVVRLQRPRMVKAFQEALHAALVSGDDPAANSEVDLDNLDSWSLQDASDLEEKIAVSNMVSKADALYAQQLRELEQRMEQLSAQASGAVSPKALSSGRLVEAFQHSMKQLELELPIKLVIYKLFDLTVLSRMGNVFTGANEVLEAGGYKAVGKPAKPKAAAPRPRPMPMSAARDALAQAAGMPAAPAGWTPPAYATGLSQGHLAAAMQPYVGGGPGGGGAGGAGGAMPMDVQAQAHANSQLANEMLALMEAVGEGRPVDSWMPAQNLSLVGRMFDDMYTDSRLTDAARPMLGKLQFPVMKVALSDPTFFENPRHPVRSLVNDVFETLTTDGTATGADFHRLEELLLELLKRFDPDPAKLRQKQNDLIAVTEAEASKFLDQQKARLEEQRKNLHEKVRNIVRQELRLHLNGRQPPKPAMKVLLSGFAPLLALRYLNGGPTGLGWVRALDLLDRVLASFDPPFAASAERSALEDGLCAEVKHELTQVGIAQDTVVTMGERLREAYEETALQPPPAVVPASVAAGPVPAESAAPQPAGTVPPPAAVAGQVAPAAPPPQAAAESVLLLLLRAGEWFRVWEAEPKTCRWLKLVQYYSPADRVVFEDFAGDNRLQMKATVFGHDLAAGRSVPVNPSPVTSDLIGQLPPAPEHAVDPGAAWFKPGPPEGGDRRAA